jgi:molecular chaperone HscC
MDQLIVGIDLGTTHSLCAIFAEGRPRLIANAHGEVLTPSVVGILDDGSIVVGAAAKELRVTRPEVCCSCFKRWMGSDQKVTLRDKTFTSTELSSFVLRSLKQDAEKFFGHPIRQAVITVPAYFNDPQRKATKQAGELAGFTVRRIINEPTAAALTYGFHDRQAEKKLLVVDLGGGTFDVTLMDVFEGTLEIVATAGESQLGGEDFTDRIVATVWQREKIPLETAEIKFPLRTARLRQECEAAKRQLAEHDSATIRIPNAAGVFEANAARVRLQRTTFGSICQSLMERIKRPVDRVLRDGKLDPEGIDEVLLVGGATRMRMIRDFVQSYFGRPGRQDFDPDQVVALGAAVQAALIIDDRAVQDMVLTDVSPFTLGVEVVKEFGGRMSDGYFQPIIHRNTTIPVSREESFSTVTANQTEVRLRVFQGESRRVKDNLLLGELQVTGIPPGPAGQEVLVRFTYDLNGILEVEAIVPGSGKRFQTVLTQHASSLSREEIAAAVKRLQQLKFYPRDDLRNQRLVLFAERMIGEINPLERATLEQAIDSFERAMSSGNHETFESARQGLLIVLSALGIEYNETETPDQA